MKKLTYFILIFALLFSLAMPAMAAEPAVNGSTSGNVSGTFDPGKIEFNGIAVNETDSNSEYRFDEAGHTYTILVAPDKIGGSAVLYFDVVGTNLQYTPDDNTKLTVKMEEDDWENEEPYDEIVSFLRSYGSFGWSVYGKDGHREKISYTNDGGESWTTYMFEIKQSYYVNVSESENGTVTANGCAFDGETVDLTVTPAPGYELQALTVMNGETELEVTNNSFTMPAEAVTVSATFKVAPPRKITVNASENGTVTSEANEASVGTTVALTVTPVDDYRLSELTVNDGTVEVTKINDNTYTFVMPNVETSVTATFEKIPHAVTIVDSENGTVSADKLTAVAGETVTLNWTAEQVYELGSITVTDANGEKIDVDQGLTACTFIMPTSDVTVEAVFEEIRIISVDIVWGPLAYTYTDENGWQNDSNAPDAGTVTVTNSGEATFYTKAIYNAELRYMNIRGSFDHGVTQLAANESRSFKLSLNNKPEQVLNGQKIGAVTIHISETEFEDVEPVSNETELLNALLNGYSRIKFNNDIEMSDVLEINSDVAIDLNGFTFDGINFTVIENANVSISGGTINMRPGNYGGELTISDCTINGAVYAISSYGGYTKIFNSTMYAVVLCRGGTVELDADVVLKEKNGYYGLSCENAEASVICHFNPTEYIYKDPHLKIEYNITDNGDGTWTITKK